MLRLKVEGMSCQHCVNAITKAVGDADPLAMVEISLEQNTVSVESRVLDEARLRKLLAAEGYEPAPSLT